MNNSNLEYFRVDLLTELFTGDFPVTKVEANLKMLKAADREYPAVLVRPGGWQIWHGVSRTRRSPGLYAVPFGQGYGAYPDLTFSG